MTYDNWKARDEAYGDDYETMTPEQELAQELAQANELIVQLEEALYAVIADGWVQATTPHTQVVRIDINRDVYDKAVAALGKGVALRGA